VAGFVNPAEIPLYLHSGPNLEVHVANTDTANWLKDRLLASFDQEPDDDEDLRLIQCPVAILLDAQDSGKKTGRNAANYQSSWDRVTHLLVYGILKRALATEAPESDDQDQSNEELRIYATALCGGREAKVQALPSPPQTPKPADSTPDSEVVQFLPDLRSPSPKRKRVATLFEDAAEFHKKARRSGGIRLAEPVRREASQSLTEFPSVNIKREISEQEKVNVLSGKSTHKPPTLSRSSTFPSTVSGLSSFERSRSKSISSRQATPTLAPKPLSRPLFTAPSHSIDTPSEEVLSTNKALLTRTILTSMRMYGYHRKARPTRPTTPAASFADSWSQAATAGESQEQPPTLETDEDDEFKAMYHATYRATTFALRRFLKSSQATAVLQDGASPTSVPVLSQDKAMSVVDSVLKLFCET
jgi:hypothetical protein